MTYRRIVPYAALCFALGLEAYAQPHSASFVNQFNTGHVDGRPANPGDIVWGLPSRRTGQFLLGYSNNGQPVQPGAMEWNVGLLDPQTIALNVTGWVDTVPQGLGGYINFNNVLTVDLTAATAFRLQGTLGTSGGSASLLIEPMFGGGINGVATGPNGELRLVAAGSNHAIDLAGTLLQGHYRLTLLASLTQNTTETHVLTLGVTSCYANCDGTTVLPVLTANDFLCFLVRFTAGDSYANCDGSTVAPVLTANDFQCFLNAFSAGCP